MATNHPQYLTQVDRGFRLSDDQALIDAALNLNSASQTSAITAIGTTQATAVALTAVVNEISIAAASTGVQLPSTVGRRNTPFIFCFVTNNGANPVRVYAKVPVSGVTADTINGVAGATGILIAPATTVLFVSAKAGAWLTLNSFITGTSTGTFTATGATPVTVTNAAVTANSQILVTLKTVGGTVSVSTPAVQTITPGTGFTIAALTSDTSVYNYAILG